MSALSIGLSGLLVNQRLLDLTGQNIANANNPSFHRQVATLGARINGGPGGAGVEILQLQRVVNSFLERALTRNQSASGDLGRRLDGLTQIQGVLTAGDGSLSTLLEKFFNQAQELTQSPQDLTQRRQLVATAATLAGQLNGAVSAFQNMGADLVTEGLNLVDKVNLLGAQIADLNFAVKNARAQGVPANDLEDRRDDLVSQLADLIDVRTVPQDLGQVNVLVAGLPLVLDNQSVRLKFQIDANNQAGITTEGSTGALALSGGKLAGLLALRNDVLPQIRAQFDAFARGLVTGIDEIHARGIGLIGPFSFLAGERGVRSATAPLTQVGLAYPPRAGSVVVSMTDLSTGKRTLHEVAIDPASQSLQDVATALSAIPNLQAVVNAQTGTMTLLARPGFAFDFAGQLASGPTTSAVTGTAAPQVSGTFTGSTNDVYAYKVVGTGRVGETPGLSLEVRDSGGTLLRTFNIGQGYEPDAKLPGVNGVQIQIGAGTVNNGDTFTVKAVADSDSAGLLSALGLNSFFTGSDAADLAVRSDLLASPQNLALAKSDNPSDGANLLQMVQLRDQTTFNQGTQTLFEYLTSVSGTVAGQVQDLGLRKDAQDAVGAQLTEERQGLSGVDPNEELARLVQFQRAYQMSARFVSVVNDTMNALLQMV